jgi:serine/threonine protein kinase
MGAVYRGLDESLGVEVAVKENFFVSPEAERQFEREAKLLALLRHPNLPRVTDHFVLPEQGQYLVMDYVPGDDVKTILDRVRGPLPTRDVLSWAKSIMDALKYMHGRQPPVVHRDVKPGNIRINPDGRAVLVDFGLAKVHDPTRSTTTGAKAFTPGFAPPEQYGLGRTDVRTDIYALGATLYAMFTGVIPADGLERAMGQAKLTPVRAMNPAIPEGIAAAVERALAIKPDERFSSIVDFEAALIPTQSQATVVSSGPVTEFRPAQGPAQVAATPAKARPSGMWILVGALGLAVVLVGGGLVLVLSGGLPVKTPIPSSAPPSPLPTQESAPTEAPATPTSEPLPTAAPSDTPLPEATPTAQPAAKGGGPGQIAFVSEREGRPQVFLMNIDGSNVTRVTSLPDGACQPAWSPDGEYLLIVSPCRAKQDEYANGSIFSIRPDGSDLSPVITLLGGSFDPDWSAAGIAFTHLEEGKPRIWVAPEDASSGTKMSRISGENSADRQPSWSPGGDRMVFVNTSRSNGVPVLFWIFQDGSFQGSNPDQVTRDQSAGSPDWSPNGDLIAYTASSHIWLVPWDERGYGTIRVTEVGPNDDPDWSPDGQWITFESWRDAANHEIYIMTLNGGQQTRLTNDPALDYHPAWRP